MIAFVEGVVVEIRENSVIVQSGGFGLEVLAPKPTLMTCRRAEALRLTTHLVIKEDSWSLYGFNDPDMHRLFTYLISVSGIGPKLALAMLSALPTTLLAEAILKGDAALLASSPGVGKKMAERIVLDLKNKLPEELMAKSGAARAGPIMSQAGQDAVEALLALGYRETQV
nr:Holliday junction branch migration protein RuvA [Deinococcota bacterium]